MICHSTDSTFNSDLRNEGLTLVNFWATWCSPCRMFASVLEDYDATRQDDVRIIKINVDENAETPPLLRSDVPSDNDFVQGREAC